MKSGISIKDAVKILAGKSSKGSVMVKVVSVQEASLTCTVFFEDAELTLDKVRLKSIESTDKDGLIIFPAADSYVLISSIEGTDEFYVVMTSKVDKIWLRGDTYNSTRADRVAERIARLENALNRLQTKYNAHVHPETGATTGPTATQSTEVVLPETNEEYIQNDKVKHG